MREHAHVVLDFHRRALSQHFTLYRTKVRVVAETLSTVSSV